MTKRFLTISLLCLVAARGWAAAPVPKDYFGFEPGDDYKLAGYAQIRGYFEKLAAASDRIRLMEFGKSSLGKPMFVAMISSVENLAQFYRYREISRRLAVGEASAEEARRLAAEGKAIVWIDSGLHATEVAPAQHAPELAWRLVNGEGEEAQRIRRNVILLQVPVINPDGLDMVVEWYRRNLGTPYELARLPWLFQKYAGHDNNRDWFMLNLDETRAATRLLFGEWFPQIVYDQHQSAPFPARIFVPPYANPLNPHIPAEIEMGINQIGAAIGERLAREDKPGAISFANFDAWWDGGLRSAPAFHNMHGILTETAASGYATPHEYKPSDLPERFSNGLSTREPSVFYPLPWKGGMWRLRDAVDYMLTVDFAILNEAATRPEHYLLKAWELARANIEAGRKGNPYAYVIPEKQWDPSSAIEMLRRLAMAGIDVRRARGAFQAGGKSYPVGTWVLLAAQPFRPYLMDLLEPQRYPDAKKPYDVAGWTLSMQMGVAVDRVDDPFEAPLDRVLTIVPPVPINDRRQNVSFLATAAALERGEAVRRGSWQLLKPRVAIYEPWTANSDTGWTQWLLDRYRVPYMLVHNEDMRRGKLRAKFDCLILASQTPESILHGRRNGETVAQRPEYSGGIGIAGLHELDTFVREGGTLLAFGAAAELPAEMFPLPVRNMVRRPADGGFFSPGSLLRVDVDTASELAAGMPREAIVFSDIGRAWEINTGEREARSVVRYARANLLASGLASGESEALGQSVMVEARHGAGRVVLYGFRPQFRGQTFGTFKLVLNAIYLASAKAAE